MEEWESDSDGGLGTSCLPFLRPRSGVASRFCRGPAAAVNSGEWCPSWPEVDGSLILPGQAANNPADARLGAAGRLEARELEREYQGGLG